MTDTPRYFNRELSWLDFNARVLEEAQDPTNPLVERARFLAIVTNNNHEFTMVRVAGLHRKTRQDQSRDPAALTPAEQLDRVRDQLARLTAAQYACWNDPIRPRLAEAGLALIPPAEWNEEDRASLAVLYRERLEMVLTPMAVDPTRPFPLIGNLALYLAVLLRDPERPDELRHALVGIPGDQRLFALPATPGRFVLAEDVVAAHLAGIFQGYTIEATCPFRIARDGDLAVDEDQADDLLTEIEQGLRARAHGRPVLLELPADADERLADWLQERLELPEADLSRVPGPLDLTFLFGAAKRTGRPDLEFEPFDPRPCPVDWNDPFAAMREGELLLHHPFQSFDPVVQLVEHAAADPQVLAIKMTLYRVSGDSPIIAALIRAAHARKQVTVLLELRARFDEEANINWARQLEQAGAHVIYGIKGLKVHAKLLLIIRRDEDGIRRYCHLGTGNYNDKTARIYTDLGYLTCHEAVGHDMSKLFNVITGFCLPPEWLRLAVAPTDLRETFYTRIRHEAENARAGRPARIIAKFNSLVDTGIADELYAASRAGVDIDLLVRGICILRPGVPDLSENIRVHSIVGRFLEHSRIYWFENDGDPRVGIASADWMTRNLDRRIEHLVWIENHAIEERLKNLLELYLADTVKTRRLEADGSYTRLGPSGDDHPLSVQDRLLSAPAPGLTPPDQDDAPRRETAFIVMERSEED